MNIKINKKIINLHNFQTEDEIYMLVQNQLYWPRCAAYVLWNENELEISSEDELRFICRMIAEEKYTEYKKSRQEFEEIEEKLKNEQQEYISDSEILYSDDDITQEDFYQMGYRREIT